MIDFQWLIGGEAGYGIMTTGLMMSKIASRLGLSVFDYVEYPSLIRGGHNAYYVRASSEEIFSQKKPVNILVALNKATVDKHIPELSDDAVVVYDPDSIEVDKNSFAKEVILCAVPLLKLAHEAGGEKMMINTVSVGASLALISDDFSILEELLKETFGKKGNDVVSVNVKCAKAGFDFVKNLSYRFGKERAKKTAKKQLLLSGSEAIGMGAIRAGMKFAAIYPMTPINNTMSYLVSKAAEYSLVVKEPEDEIAGLNMAIGAGFTGVRSMVATAGGGFSLMTEALGLAAQAEVPVVIIWGMRPGPATGLPTWTGQADLQFALHAHQDDFPRVILAPGDGIETFSAVLHAFNLAEKYQLPVIVLVDKYLNESHFTLPYDLIKAKSDKYRVDRGKLLGDEEAQAQEDYKRYLLSEDGVSPRSIPGQKGGIALTGSDEHDEKGLYNEEAENRIAMMDKRFKKVEDILSEIPPPELIGNVDAPLTIVAFGTTKMPVLEAMKWLADESIYVNFLKFNYISPFKTDEITKLLSRPEKTLIIEANREGQFEAYLREKTGIEMDESLRKYDGRPFYPEEIVEKVKQIL